jgi:hypothetical protein
VNGIVDGREFVVREAFVACVPKGVYLADNRSSY